MAYNPDKSWEQLVADFEPKGLALLKAIREAKGAYDEWVSFRNARTDADIATALDPLSERTVVAADVANMGAAFSAFDAMQRYLDNDTPPASLNHGFAIRVIS